MIIEGEYLYKGVSRLSWGFGSPNQLGAFVASAIPLVWGAAHAVARRWSSPPQPKGKKPARFVRPAPAQMGFWLVELGLWLALGATASRGAAVATLCAAAAWVLGGLMLDRTRWGEMTRWFGLRVGMCILGLVVFSFGGRIAPGFLVQDDSIGNRFILWNGAANLVAASPWTGWGVGESGNAFMQWVQPLHKTEAYKTMVNSFLHVGVERGIPGLGLLLFLTFSAVSCALVFERRVQSVAMRGLVRAASCIVLAWALNNVFSTLFKDWRLWILPGLAVGLLLGSLPFVRPPVAVFFRWVGAMAAAAILAVAALWLVGLWSNARRQIQLTHPSRELTVLSRGSHAEKPQLGLLVDKDVLGGLHGHEIRRWGEEYGDIGKSWSVAVFDAHGWSPDSSATKEVPRWILLGENARAADSLGPEKTVVFLHPRGQPPQRWAGKGVVIFNGVDEEGTREFWIQWANRWKLRIVTIPEIGLDARAKWPSAYLANLETNPQP